VNNTLYLTQTAPYNITTDSAITGGALSFSTLIGMRGEITVTVLPMPVSVWRLAVEIHHRTAQ
jgi:hypothetical protein